MAERKITCVECPFGCTVSVTVEKGNVIKIEGNNCPRGKAYAENEITYPRRVLTTTVRTEKGNIFPVKTDKPVKKEEMFLLMSKINAIFAAEKEYNAGDLVMEKITENINLIAADHFNGAYAE